MAISLITSGAVGGYWLADNKGRVQIAECKEKAATAVSEAYKARDKAVSDLLVAQQAKEQAISAIGERYVAQISSLKRSNSGLSNRLRGALDKACITVHSTVMPSPPTTPSGGNGSTDNRGFRPSIVESIRREVIEPGDTQAAQLIACQSYIRAIQ